MAEMKNKSGAAGMAILALGVVLGISARVRCMRIRSR